jgi:hypothetical protein
VGDAAAATDAYDVPLGGLTGLARVRFERTHMEAAAAEVRFVANRDELTENDAKRMWHSARTSGRSSSRRRRTS